MKVSVITLWDNFTNYGQILQCWALQQVLLSEGYEADVARFIPGDKRKRERIEKMMKIYPLFNVVKGRIVRKKQNTFSKLDSTGLREWANSHIRYSEERWNSIGEIRATPPVAECYVVGSDQVWLQKLRYADNYAYFLDFGPKTVKRIAYAPSFGMEHYPRRWKKELTRLLNNLDAVSVREQAGVRICEECGVKALNVLDPTLLLTEKEYEIISDKEYVKDTNYVFLYNININQPSDIKWDDLQKFAGEKGMNIVVAQGIGFEISMEIFGSGAHYEYLSMGKWLSGIRNAKLVVASSFHCVVFSIILKTPFVYAPIKGEHSVGNNRALDLMRKLGLEDRELKEGMTYQQYADKPIDWDSVYAKLDKWRDESRDYLFSSIKG